jgi:hypothetical protein
MKRISIPILALLACSSAVQAQDSFTSPFPGPIIPGHHDQETRVVIVGGIDNIADAGSESASLQVF